MNQNYNFVQGLFSQVMNARNEKTNLTSPKKQTLVSFIMVLVALFSFVQGNSQVTTNGGSGLATSYSSLSAAITALNSATISSPVTITLTASETAPAGGYSITASGTSTNTITLLGGGFTVTAPAQTAGNLNDAIFKIIGGDFITIQNFILSERVFTPVATDITASSNTMTEWGVALLYATTTNGSQNCTIQNNTISLNRTYQNTFGIYANATHSATVVTTIATATTAAGGNSGLKVYANNISNVNLGIVVVGPTAIADANTGIDIGGSSSSTGNTITNYGTTGTFSGFANVSGTVNGILVRNSNGFNASYNSITSSNGGVTAGTLNGIQVAAASTAPTATFTNNITNNTIALTTGFSGAINGITYPSGSASATSVLNVNSNNFTAATSTVTSSVAIVLISVASTNLTTSISNNNFTNITSNTTGSFTFISHNYIMAATGSQTINNNSIVTAFSKTGIGGTLTFVTTNSTSATGATATVTNNNFSNVTVTGTTAITGIFSGDGNTGIAKNYSSNVLSNWTAGSGTIIGISLNYIGGTCNFNSNTISNITGQGTITGLSLASSGVASTVNVSSNTINNLSSTGTGGQVIGISCANTSTIININGNAINTLSSTGASSAVGGILVTAATTTNIYSNTIYGITSSGITSPLVLGISVQGGTTVNTYQNKIYGLSVSGAISTASPAVIGINVTGGTNVNTYNNILGGLTAPAASLTDAIRGINIASTTATSNQKVYFNTVYMNATSTGANFGSTGLFHTYSVTATTSALDMRNNIINNASVANGTGLSVAFRRSASTNLLNYASTSNNNLFFGTSGVYNDGTNTDLGLAAFQTRVTPRETASKSQNPTFDSTTGSAATFLHFTAGDANLAGDNGATISGFTTDFDGDTRTSTPDIGADEWANGIIAPPTISNFTTAFSSVAPITLCQDGGQTVTITGTNLGTVTSVLFNGSTGINLVGAITATTSTSITVTTPAGLVAGNIRVINPVGQVDSAYVYTTAGSPTVGVTSNLSACAAVGTTLTATGAATYTWTPSTALSATTGASVIASPTTNTTYTVRGTDSNGCAVTNTVTITVLPTPSAIAITSAPSSICAGGVATLVATGGSIPVAQTILSENFNAGIGTFTSTTLSSSAPQNWAPQVNGYSYPSTPHTGSVSGFMMANSDVGGGSGSTANTQLISPSFSTVGFNNLSLNFIEYLNNPNDAAAIEISDNNFVTSTILRNQTANDIGTASAFNITTIAIPATFENKLNVKIRFRFEGSWDYWWAIDEIVISGNPLQPISWTSASNLFTDSAATSAYTNQDIRTVYSTVSGSQNYTATATGSNGCTSSATVTVTPLPLPSAPTATNSSQCGARVPTATVASSAGAAGTGTFKWYDQATGGTPIQSGTSAFLTTYSVSATTTLYVSEVGTNGCESLRTPVTITVGAAPALTISAAPSAICSGASTTTPVTITSTLADFNQYTWAPTTGVTGDSTVGYTFNPTATTNYVLSSLNSTTGCTNLANLTITVNPLPVITSATTSVEPLCIGSSTTLTGLSLNLVSGTATIGTATTRTSATEQPTAFCNRWGSYRMQLVYTAAEIIAAGFSAGNITSIAFDISTLGDSATNSGFIVKMGTTSLSTLTQFESTTGYTTVFPSQTYTHTATGVQTIPFSTPFVWDGTSNIIIEMVHDGADLTNNSRTYFTQTTNNTVAYTSTSATDTASLSNKRLNIIFGGQIRNDISSNYNWSWAPTATLVPSTGNVVVATPAVNTVYTATATNPTTNCSATGTVSVSLLPLSATAPTATSSTHCGLQLSTATVTSTTATVNPVFLWYNVASGGTSVQGGPSRTFLTAINSTRTMYVAEVGPNGCESLRTPVVMSVNAPPVVTITSSVPTFCGTGGATTLTANSSDPGMTYTWTSFTGTTTTSALNTRVITATLSETSEFKVVGIATDTSCLPIEAEISVGVYPLPTATVTSSAQGVCPGTSATIGSGLSAGNFSATCIPAPSGGPATSPAGAVSLVGNGALQTPYPAGVTVNSATNLDDNFWGGIPVGFNFNFFGNTVTNVFIGSNGTISLGSTGSTAFTFTDGFPSTTSPASTIAVVARDLHWNRTGSGKISYWTEGIAPNRRFVVQFLNATTFDSDFTTGLPYGKQTTEAVFYETLGTIDIRVFEATYNDEKYIGLQDGTKLIGATAPNCAATPATPNYWNGVTNEIAATAPQAWRFSPPASYTTTWYADGVAMPSVTANPSATPPVVGYANPGTNVFSIPVAPVTTTTYSITYTNLNSGCSNAPGSAQVVMAILGNTIPAGLNSVVSSNTICLGQSVNLSTTYTGTNDGLVFQWQNSIDGGTTWNDIASANALTLTHTPEVPSQYRCKLVACNGVPGYTSAVSVGFNNSVLTSTAAVRCGVGTATLTATGSTGATLNWYTSASGGAAIGTGTSFLTPTINTSTTYYVGAETITPQAVNVGSTATPSSTFTTSSTNGGMVFNTTIANVRINSASIFVSGTGDMVFNLQDASGVDIATTTLTGVVGSTTGLTTVNFPSTFVVPNIGIGYKIICTSLGTGLTWYYQTGAYPFNTPGVSITSGWGWSDFSTDLRCIHKLNFTLPTVCSSSRTPVVVTVTPPPAITLSANPATICAESNTTPVTVVTGASDYSSYVWSPTSVTGNSTTGWVFNPLTTTTYTLLASQTTGATPCANIATVSVNVNPTPSVITISSTPVSACANIALPLVATGGSVSTVNNFSMDVLPTNFTLEDATISTVALNTNYYSQGTGSVLFNAPGTSANASYSMNSNLNMSDATSASLTFSHIAAMEGTAFSYDYGYVEYSINGGTTWVTFTPSDYSGTATTTVFNTNARFTTRSYADWITQFTSSTSNPGVGPATSLWKTETFNIPASALTSSQFRIRFRYTTDSSTNFYGWLIDDVKVNKTIPTTMAWTPTANLYTDAAATTPYTGQNLSTVYFKTNAAAAAVTYTATATSTLGCPRVATVPVTVYQTAAPTGVQFYQFCPSGGATVSSMSPALIGSNIKWYSVSTGGTALAPTTPLTQGYYWASQTLNGCESPTRYVVFAISNATAAPSSSASQQFCNSATVANLTANGSQIKWYNVATGGTALASTAALSSGTYYATQTSGGCESPRTAVSVTVTAVSAPTGAATQSLSSLLTLGDIVVTGSNIVWYASAANAASGTNPLASTQLLANTTYYATQTINGCTSNTSLAVTITTLANQDFDMTQFTFYPNPVIDLLNITYSQDMTSVKVFNMVGQQLMSKQVNSNTVQVDMSSYANGAYFIQVTTENAMKTVRVIKK